MTNDPRAFLAVGMLTAFIHKDEEGFRAITDEFEGGCPEALAALARVTEAVIAMLAETAETTKEDMLTLVATAIAEG